MSAASRDDRAIALACVLVARHGGALAIALTRARITASLDNLCDMRHRLLYGDGRAKPVGLTSGG